MEEKYGKRLKRFGTVPMVYMPMVCAEIALIIVFGALLNGNLKNGQIFSFAMVIALILMLAVLVIVIRLIFVSCVELYDQAIVVRGLTNVDVYEIDKIDAILWTFPGVNPVNSRSARVNNTFAELIVKGERKGIKLSADYYKGLEKPLTAYQNERGIPANLEIKKGAKRYD